MLPAKRANWLPSIFNDFFGNEWIERNSQSSPAVNIKENDREYRVEVAAPGMTKDDFHIELHDDNHLTVSMEKRSDKRDEGEGKENEGRYLRREFSYSSFRQSMILPDNVDTDNISAKVEDGILSIGIPKTVAKEEEPKTKKIEIR